MEKAEVLTKLSIAVICGFLGFVIGSLVMLVQMAVQS
jgi:hypothetical protein